MTRPAADLSLLTPPPLAEAEAVVAVVLARLEALEKGAAPPDAPAVRVAEAAMAALPEGGRAARLLALFGAPEGARAPLLTALAAALDPAVGQGFARLTGRAWATDWLAARLFPECDAAPAGDGPLADWALVRVEDMGPGEPAALRADAALPGWIAGRIGVPPALAGVLAALPHATTEGAEDWPVAATAQALSDALGRGERCLLAVRGTEGTGRARFAAAVAARLGLRALAADPAAAEGGLGRKGLRDILRLAHVAGAALVWRDPPPGFWPGGLWPPALQAVALAPSAPLPEARRLALLHVTLPPLDPAARARLLRRAVPGAALWPPGSVERLARRRALTPGLIARLGRIAPATPEAAAEAANAAQEAALGDLAQRLPAGPGWEDLALPDRLAGALRDLAHEIETRAEVWADPAVARVFRREAGLVAVMHGPPGTGKTMGAQVVAAAAGRDLFRVDCATVVSKYIGETSKNLRALFDRARGLDAVLFFDEADALFARRTEVRDSHDRYANTDTAELLQLVEGALEGCVILATNRLGDVDPAFLRRIRYVFEFPRPDAAARTAIWVRAGVVLAPQMEATVWQRLAQALELTGAQIKTTLLAAHFAARRQGRGLALPDLVAAAERELAKEGRGLGAREREMLRHA